METTAEKKILPKLSQFFLAFLIFLLLVLLFLIGCITITFKGPSPIAKDILVTTFLETSALKFIPKLYFSEKEINQILENNAVMDSEEVSDVGFVFEENATEKENIEIIDISGKTFKGKLMIIQDPSRIKLAALSSFDSEKMGKKVEEFVKQENAIAGINAGGFEDVNGVGKGGQPLGLMIKDSQIINGTEDRVDTLIGFNQENKLIVGRMSGKKALELGMRDAVTFGPVFIVNGKAQKFSGVSGGLNPRTVIGQRKDGAVLLLVIDGRQAQSLGATYEDCIKIMMEYGAYNAANLDGGSSSIMVYQDEIINTCASLYGSRRMPAAFIVTK
ncbi:MAG: phosphodiester glycosidase family protein [Clostridia bacterium]|nr:phosphodiester glycosidase family protein [Clostridia bacterium]